MSIRSGDLHVLAVDLGTSGCKAALVSRAGSVAAWAFHPVATQILPGAGAEQCPQDWWQAFVSTARQVIAESRIATDDIAALCCSTQGEGTIAVDSQGLPLMPAMTWRDMRGGAHIRRHSRGWLNVAGYDALKLQRWLRLCGGAPNLSGKDPAAHMLFVRDTLPDIYARTYKFLNVLDYFNLRLTGRYVATSDSILTSWVTDNRDPSNIRYDAKLIAASGIDAGKFPELVRCTDIIGTVLPAVAAELGLSPSTKVIAGAIDNTAAAIGAGTLNDYDAHLYIGTSSWIGAHVPRKHADLRASIASVPCAVPGKYLLIAMQTSAGSNLTFLKEKVLYHQDELLQEAAKPDIYQVLDQIAARVPPGSDGLMYTPWLFGERCPVEEPSLRAGLFNLSPAHSRETIVRAYLEGVALNARWLIRPVERALGRTVAQLTMLGGGGNSNVWCQIFADVLGIPIRQLAEPMQANAVGAAYIAFTGLGLIDFSTAASQTRYRQVYLPHPATQPLYAASFENFTELFRRLRPLYRRINQAKA